MTDLEKLVTQWEGYKASYAATEDETIELLTIASTAKDDHPAIWPRLEATLAAHTDMAAKAVKAEVRRARITADLGTYPFTAEEFVPAFLTSRGYRMDYAGVFTRAGRQYDPSYILSEMNLWSSQIAGGRPVFAKDLIESAFLIWEANQKDRLLTEGYARLAYDPEADRSHLREFAAYITESIPGDPVGTARAVRATEVAFRNFIYRTKNHMRRRWAHSCHLMPVLTGKQGSAKSYAVEAFLKPLGSLFAAVSFDLFGDNSKEFELTTLPVMFFDEMAGIGKADVEKLKGVMTLPKRSFRQIYRMATTRAIMSTFIGCSNRDIDLLIRDETGNRRFIQINTPNAMKRSEIDKFDMLAMWRSVDEDAEEPPMFAHADDLTAIQTVQSEQRHRGAIYEWVMSGEAPATNHNVPTLYSEHFHPWAERMFPQQAKFIDLNSFRKELERLRQEDIPDAMVRTLRGNVVHYRFTTDVSPERAKIISMIDGKAIQPERSEDK